MKEKIKNKMSVKKKVFISILLIVLSFILGSTIYTFVAPPVYLAVKYDTSPFNYKLDRYDPAIYVFDLNNFDDYFTTPTWQYTYNDKELMVQFFDNSFYDDYQMEYLFNESIKRLQKNVDSRIDCFDFTSGNVYGTTGNEKLNITIWNHNNIDKFINNITCVNIYVKVDNLDVFYDKNNDYNDYYYEFISNIENKFRSIYSNVSVVKVIIHKNDLKFTRNIELGYKPYSRCGVDLEQKQKWHEDNFIDFH